MPTLFWVILGMLGALLGGFGFVLCAINKKPAPTTVSKRGEYHNYMFV